MPGLKKAGLALSALATAGFGWLAYAGGRELHLAALVSAFIFFRLATGTYCPLVWLMTKLGAKGLSCPVDLRKQGPGT